MLKYIRCIDVAFWTYVDLPDGIKPKRGNRAYKRKGFANDISSLMNLYMPNIYMLMYKGMVVFSEPRIG